MVQKIDNIGAICVANGMGERDELGSYIKFVAIDERKNYKGEFLISKGQAENFGDELICLVLKMRRRHK